MTYTCNWNCCRIVAVVNVHDRDIVVDVLDMNDDDDENEDVHEWEEEEEEQQQQQQKDDDDISWMDDENAKDLELNEDLKMDVKMEN